MTAEINLSVLARDCPSVLLSGSSLSSPREKIPNTGCVSGRTQSRKQGLKDDQFPLSWNVTWGLRWEGSFMIAWMVKSQSESQKVKKEKREMVVKKKVQMGQKTLKKY